MSAGTGHQGRREDPAPHPAPLGGRTPLSLDGPESPAEHVRTALQLLDSLEREFRGLGLILPDEQALELYGPLVAARARLWRAIHALEHITTEVAP